MIQRAFIGSIIAHAALAGGLLWAASVRVITESVPSPMIVDLVAESAGAAMAQPVRPPVETVRVVRRPVLVQPVITPQSIEPAASSEFTAELAVPMDPLEIAPAESSADSDAAIESESLKTVASSAEMTSNAWAEFYAAVRAAIERAKRYPPSARLMGQEDLVVLSFLIAPDGRAGELHVVAPSRFPVLNRAAIETIQRVAAFPLPPADAESAGVRVRVPMVFALHNEGAGIE
jgi:protein TonB